MSSKLNELKNVLGIGARANKYRVILNTKYAKGQVIDVLAKSSTLPERSFAEIPFWYQGRLVTLIGDATFDGDWVVTFYDDEKHTLKGAFIKWMEDMDSPLKHTRKVKSHSEYMVSGEIHILSTSDNKMLTKYKFEDVYPKHISGGELSDSSNDMLLEFTVTFNYSTWSKE